MLKHGLFKKPNNHLEEASTTHKAPAIPGEIALSCPSCKKMMIRDELRKQYYTCGCGYNFKLSARTRLNMILDRESFCEQNGDLYCGNILRFPGYDEKLSTAQKASGEKEAVICGTGRIDGIRCAVFSMEAGFMMGSMGTVVGEKLTRLFECSKDSGLPVIGFIVSGGARMQEGILSLMQMAKVSGAVKRHSDAGLLYIAILTDPTTGGVTASFAMQGDIIIAEPNALIGFAGPRVIEQTTRQKLPPGFQRSEFLLEKGFLDDIVPRSEQRKYLARILKLHGYGELICMQ